MEEQTKRRAMHPWQQQAHAAAKKRDAAKHASGMRGAAQMTIPIAEHGDGVPLQHDESAVPLKEDNDEHIENLPLHRQH